MILTEQILKDNTELKDDAQSAAKNSISFDLSPHEIVENDGHEEFFVIVLQVKNDNFKNVIRPSQLQICGKTMQDWVQSAVVNYPVYTLPYDGKSDVLSVVRPHLRKSKYTAVFYSDTPLLKKETVDEIFTYARSHNICVMKLARGYVFETEYIKTATNITESFIHHFGDDDFFEVSGYQSFCKACEIMKKKIIAYHISRGVVFYDSTTAYVEADVEIESGTIIEPHVVLCGQTLVGKNCRVGSFCKVVDSILCDECWVSSCEIVESKIGKGKTIEPYQRIFKKVIE